jgi:hypothetical protein
MAYGLADAPPDAVAEHRLPERARRREANVRTPDFAGQAIRLRFAHAESREERAGVLDAAIVDPAEILGTQQTDTFRKTSDGRYLSELTVNFLRPRARRRARTARPFFVSIRERKP